VLGVLTATSAEIDTSDSELHAESDLRVLRAVCQSADSPERGTVVGFAIWIAKDMAIDERIESVEAAWRSRFGDDSVARLRRALEEVVVR